MKYGCIPYSFALTDSVALVIKCLLQVDVNMSKELRNIVEVTPGVKSCWTARARRMGHYTLVDLEIQISDKYSSVSSAVQVRQLILNVINPLIVKMCIP